MRTLPTPQQIVRRRRGRRALLAGAMTSVLIAMSCGGAPNFSADAQFSVDLGITDGLDPLTRGKRHFANRNFGLAIEAFEEARQIAPQSVNVLNALAVAYEEIGRSEIADSYFLEALDLDPGSAQTYNNWAMVYLGRGNPVKAEQLLAEAARLSPTDPVVAGNLALAAGGSGTETEVPADAPTGALATVIAELQPQTESWTPSVRTVAPHVHFLQTVPPGTDLAAAPAGNGAPAMVMQPQIVEVDIAPMPDPSEPQAEAPPAQPVSPVVAFELDDDAEAEAALLALAAAEAGRTIIPVGASSAEADGMGAQVIRPGYAPGATIVVADASRGVVSDAAPDVAPDAAAGPVLIAPGAQIVSAELLPAPMPSTVPVGSWAARDDALAVSTDAGNGTMVTVASAPANAVMIEPGVYPDNLPDGAKRIGVGETVDPASLPSSGEIVVPPPLAEAEIVPAATESAPLEVAAAEIADAAAEIAPAPAPDDASNSERFASMRTPILLASLALWDSGRSRPADLLDIAPVLPPSISPYEPANTQLADASARLPLVVAVFAVNDEVAPETAVAENDVGIGLPLASTARVPSVLTLMAMAGGIENEEGGADVGN